MDGRGRLSLAMAAISVMESEVLVDARSEALNGVGSGVNLETAASVLSAVGSVTMDSQPRGVSSETLGGAPSGGSHEAESARSRA